jgi:hypothetical protein
MPAPEPIPDLLKAANEASGKAFALWITFLTVGTYLAISIGTTTHLQLLLAGPVRLPLLGVDLPLFAFYGFAPPMFVVLHLYVLMQLYLLARLLRRFDDDLRVADMIEQDRRRVRDQLDKFVFTQCLIGGPQDGIVRLFLWVVVWLSFVIGPVLLLLGFQLRFLPYHSIPVTYVHRWAFLLDVILLLLLWPKISRSRAQQASAWHNSKALFRICSAVCISGLLVWFSAFIAVVPGERADQPLFRSWGTFPLRQTAGFVGGSTVELNTMARPFSQSLSLPGERLVEQDEDKLKKLAVTVSLSGRDFRQAFLVGTDLRKADLHEANLSGTWLIAANLSGAYLIAATLNSTDLSDANLNNADLSHANLSFADLSRTNLTGATLAEARNLTQKQLDQACGTDAKLPPGLTLKPCPP